MALGAVYRPFASRVPHRFAPASQARLQLKVCGAASGSAVAVNCSVNVTPTTTALPADATVTCMPLVWPLPPVAQPVHNATLNNATANSRFFIIMKSLFDSNIDPNPEGTHLGPNPSRTARLNAADCGILTLSWCSRKANLLFKSARYKYA